MWEPERLTAVVHRRAALFRPLPPVAARSLRCLGRREERGVGVLRTAVACCYCMTAGWAETEV